MEGSRCLCPEFADPCGRCLNIFPFRKPGSRLCHLHPCVAEGISANTAGVAAVSQGAARPCPHCRYLGGAQVCPLYPEGLSPPRERAGVPRPPAALEPPCHRNLPGARLGLGRPLPVADSCSRRSRPRASGQAALPICVPSTEQARPTLTGLPRPGGLRTRLGGFSASELLSVPTHPARPGVSGRCWGL